MDRTTLSLTELTDVILEQMKTSGFAESTRKFYTVLFHRLCRMANVNAMLPYLMRYMGHQSVSETLYYFHFVPEFFPTYRTMSAPFEDFLPEVPDEE